ncbi:hypothetical protein BSU04_02665 [Caballeronia sordidicola]|jgi:hypothetical protein|uniref:Uncharacterized protein n=1 Tax=Caballeronia sordidicola TaxID=196367 RepID=A0A226XB24_CABSO|nr:hypothetical protein BSU04_02665 [Caballeronia sordidicola]
MQLGNVVAINVLTVARTATLVWPARAIHAFKRWAVIRFTGMFRFIACLIARRAGRGAALAVRPSALHRASAVDVPSMRA